MYNKLVLEIKATKLDIENYRTRVKALKTTCDSIEELDGTIIDAMVGFNDTLKEWDIDPEDTTSDILYNLKEAYREMQEARVFNKRKRVHSIIRTRDSEDCTVLTFRAYFRIENDTDKHDKQKVNNKLNRRKTKLATLKYSLLASALDTEVKVFNTIYKVKEFLTKRDEQLK